MRIEAADMSNDKLFVDLVDKLDRFFEDWTYKNQDEHGSQRVLAIAAGAATTELAMLLYHMGQVVGVELSDDQIFDIHKRLQAIVVEESLKIHARATGEIN